MNPDQSNTKPVGPVSTLAGEDLTGKRSRLVVLTHDTGVGEVKLPTSNNALGLSLLNDEAADTERVEHEPLIPGKTYRTTVKDAVNPGDALSLADVGTAADKGKLRKLPATAGLFVRQGYAEKAAGAGELVEWRYSPEIVVNPTVVAAPAALTSTNGTAGAAAADLAALAAETEMVGDDTRALHAKLTALIAALTANGQVVAA